MIGQDHAIAVLRAEISRAVESHGGLVLVTGEAGIGKTTLVTSAADEARRQGALVLGGSCWDSDNAPGYWPWTQVVRALRRTHPIDHPALSSLLGETAAKHTDSFTLYDAVTTALVSAAVEQPVVVVLDDLHWADRASLTLLEFAAQHTWFERLLLVGTYRDGEIDEQVMAPLLAKATTVSLTGLSQAEVGELITRTTGTSPAASLVAETHRRTGGNPFFVEQTARLWHSGNPMTVPPGVRDALQRRMSLLPKQVQELLATAAVLGREFDRDVLAATASAPIVLLTQAAQARLVKSLGDNRFEFVHDLVRETLYVDDPAVHAAATRAVPEPAERARHAYLAGDLIDRGEATDLLLAAARDASNRLAFDEAIVHYRRALERAPDPLRQATIALDLAHEQFHSGDRDRGWSSFESAAAIARGLGDDELFARTALTAYRFSEPTDTIPFLAEAYERMFGPPHPTRSLEELARDLSAHVAKLARDGNDDEALTQSLWASHDVSWGLGTAAERLALTEELIEVCRRSGDLGTEQFAMSLRWVALVELGDPSYVDQFNAFVAVCEREKMPRFAWASTIDRSILTAFAGGFDEAEALLRKADEVASDEPTYPSTMHLHLWWALRSLRGDEEELDALHAVIDTSTYPYPGLLAGLTALRRGDVESARPHLAGFGTRDERHQRWFEPLWIRFLAELAAATGDPALCSRAREALAPHRGQWLVSLYGCDISGPVDLYLGMVEAALGLPESRSTLAAALASAERMRSRPWADRVRRYLEPAVDNEFRRDGMVWSLRFAGRDIRLPDAKGLRDLHTLLSRPGVPVAARALLDPEGTAASRLGGDQVLDAQAKAQYQKRLATLDAEIDDAVSLGNDRLATTLDTERAALLEELRAAAGLAGRTRRLGDEAERARKAVTARIRDTLRRLDDVHPELAAHLRTTVSTGSTCLYHQVDGIHFRL